MTFQAWCGVVILVLALAFIPASALVATGSWARAWQALREYALIMGTLVVVVGGVALWAVFMESL